MAERVIVQTQSEYVSRNMTFIKWAIIIGGAIFGYMVLFSGDYSYAGIPKILGIIGFVPLGLWIIMKIMRR